MGGGPFQGYECPRIQPGRGIQFRRHSILQTGEDAFQRSEALARKKRVMERAPSDVEAAFRELIWNRFPAPPPEGKRKPRDIGCSF